MEPSISYPVSERLQDMASSGETYRVGSTLVNVFVGFLFFSDICSLL